MFAKVPIEHLEVSQWMNYWEMLAARSRILKV